MKLNVLKRSALLFLAALLTAQTALPAFAAETTGKHSSRKFMYDGGQSAAGPGTGGSGAGAGSGWSAGDAQSAGGEESSGTGSLDGMIAAPEGSAIAGKDQEAPPPTRSYGYTREEAQAVCEYLYGYETNPQKRNIRMSYLLNSIWYEPDNILTEAGGNRVLVLYTGSSENYRRTYLDALDGLEFFPNPTVMFLQSGNGELMVGVETGARFTEEQAAENYRTILQLLPMIEEVKAATAGKDNADTAKYICDYVAAKLTYDREYDRNSLGDAIRYGSTACVGYNALTEILFEHCGLSYVSIVASEIDGDGEHIFGVAKIGSAWLVFDTTNYDRDDTNEPFWIFSDKYREGLYYHNFRMVETADGFEI